LPPDRTLTINLLDPETVEQYALTPSKLRSVFDGFGPKLAWGFIDEIQKLPKLLDLVSAIIEERSSRSATRIHFALVEIKSTTRITPSDTQTLARFLPDFPNAQAFCLSNDPAAQRIQGVWCLPWQRGFEELGLSV